MSLNITLILKYNRQGDILVSSLDIIRDDIGLRFLSRFMYYPQLNKLIINESYVFESTLTEKDLNYLCNLNL